MEEKTKLVLKAYLELSSTEQEAFLRVVREYDSKTIVERRNYSEIIHKSLGPIMSAKCPICGK
jgi:hypothetical protein